MRLKNPRGADQSLQCCPPGDRGGSSPVDGVVHHGLGKKRRTTHRQEKGSGPFAGTASDVLSVVMA